MINTRSDEVVNRYVKDLYELSLEQNKGTKIKKDFFLIAS